jgi:hypothetical protein
MLVLLKIIQERFTYLYGLHSRSRCYADRRDSARHVPFGEFPAGDNMQVQMENGLASALTVINNQAESVFNTQLPGNVTRRQQQVSQQVLVMRLSIGQPGYSFFRDYQHMNGRLGRYIVNGNAMIILVDKLSGNFASDNLAKNSI